MNFSGINTAQITQKNAHKGSVVSRDNLIASSFRKNILKNDTVTFTSGISKGIIPDYTYCNLLDKPLVSRQNPDFYSELLKIPDIVDLGLASNRISSLSRYLKEDMIGFVVPEYTLLKEKGVSVPAENQQKGGYEWFEKALENILKGSKRNVKPNEYKQVAKELFGLLAVHDSYWKSNDFISYLNTLQSSVARNATIAAVCELQDSSYLSRVAFLGKDACVKMWGFFSPMKVMQDLLDRGGAYSEHRLIYEDPDIKRKSPVSMDENASLDHIVPRSWGGACDDSNYFLSSQNLNTQRGDMGLLEFLKGS